MREKKDSWENLIKLPNEYEHDPEIAQRAIEQIEREKAQKQVKEPWFKKHWRQMAVSLATCAVALAVFIPVYHSFFQSRLEASLSDSSSSGNHSVYYDDESITHSDVTDVENYVQAQSLTLKYFNYPTVITHSAVITDTKEFAFLKQEMLYIGTDGFDHVKSWSVVMTDAEFDFEEFFDEFNEEVVVSNIHIDYKTTMELDAANKIIQAKFAYESAEYYLEIETAGEAEAKIEQFVTMLIGG